jgi:hypothetical protein
MDFLVTAVHGSMDPVGAYTHPPDPSVRCKESTIVEEPKVTITTQPVASGKPRRR